jgi:nucleotide-binding universal stress UspA family protein
MLDKVLVLLDGSTLAQCVLPHAHTIAEAFGAEMTLLRVLEAEDKDTRTQVDPVNWHLRKVEAQSYLNGLLYSWPPSEAPPKIVLDEGTAVSRIVNYVETNESDLVILSTHGQSGLSASPISSVAHKIIHLIPSSFLLVRAPQAQKKESATPPYKRIMLPLDGSRRAECVLPFATKLATIHEAELSLVHVVPEAEMIQRRPFSPEETDMYNQLQQRNQREALRYLRDLADREELTVKTHLLSETRVADALLDFADSEQIDLVMMCAHGQSGGSNRLYGSLVNNFIQYSAATLFVLQDLPADQIKSFKLNASTTIATGGLDRNIAYAQPEDWKPD